MPRNLISAPGARQQPELSPQAHDLLERFGPKGSPSPKPVVSLKRLLVATCAFFEGASDVQRAAAALELAGLTVHRLLSAPDDFLEATVDPEEGLCRLIDRVRLRFNIGERDKKVHATWTQLNTLIEPCGGYCATIGVILRNDYRPFQDYFSNRPHLYTTAWRYNETGAVVRDDYLWAPVKVTRNGCTEDRRGSEPCWTASSRFEGPTRDIIPCDTLSHHKIILDGRRYIARFNSKGLVGVIECFVDRRGRLRFWPIWYWRSGQPPGPVAQRVVCALGLARLVPGEPPAVQELAR